MSSTEYTVADYIADRIAAAGTELVFGGHGAAACPLIAAIVRHPRLQWVLVRNETAAPFAAAAYAKYYRRLGVCVATSGPGANYTVCGMIDAVADAVPVLLLSGLVARSHVGHEGFQDVRTAQLMQGAGVQFAKAPMSADGFPALLDAAIRYALERSTAAHLAIPVDVQAEAYHADASSSPALPLRLAQVPQCAPESVTRAATRLAGQRVVLLAGHRAAQARCSASLLQLAEALNAPVVTTLDGKGAVDELHPLALGIDGVFGNPGMAAPRALVNTADLVLAVGVDRCDPVVTGASGEQRVSLIGLDDALCTRLPVYYQVEMMLLDEQLPRLVEALAGAVEQVGAKNKSGTAAHKPSGDYVSRAWHYFLHGQWRANHQNDHRGILRKTPHAMVTGQGGLFASDSDAPEGDDAVRGYCHPRHLLAALSERLRPDDVVVVDTGDVTIWTGLCMCFRGDGVRLLASVNMGTMGYGVPAAVSMAIALQRHRSHGRVFLVAGDGGFEMAHQELGTALQNDVRNLVVVVLRNGIMGRVRFGNANSIGDEIVLPDLEAVARAYQMGFARVQHPPEAASAVEAALHHLSGQRGSFFIDLVESPALKAEYATVESGRVPVLRAVAEYLPTEALTAQDLEMLRVFDLSGDGMLTPEEMQAARHVFENFVWMHRKEAAGQQEPPTKAPAEEALHSPVLTQEDREYLLQLLRSGDFCSCVASQKLLTEPLTPRAGGDGVVQVIPLATAAARGPAPGARLHVLGTVRDLLEGTIPSVERLARVPIRAADYVAGFELGTVDARPPDTMGEALVVHGKAYATLTGEPPEEAGAESEYYHTVAGDTLSSIAFAGIPQGTMPDYSVEYAATDEQGILWSRLLNDLYLKVHEAERSGSDEGPATGRPIFFYGLVTFAYLTSTAISRAPVFGDDLVACKSKYYREPQFTTEWHTAAVVGLASVNEAIADEPLREQIELQLYRGYFRLYDKESGKEQSTDGVDADDALHRRRSSALQHIRSRLPTDATALMSHTHALVLKHLVGTLADVRPETALRAVHLLGQSRVASARLSAHVVRGVEDIASG